MERPTERAGLRWVQAGVLVAATAILLLGFGRRERGTDDGIGRPLSEDATAAAVKTGGEGAAGPTLSPRTSSPEGAPAPFDAELRAYIPALIRPDADPRTLLKSELAWRRRFHARPLSTPRPSPAGPPRTPGLPDAPAGGGERR